MVCYLERCLASDIILMVWVAHGKLTVPASRIVCRMNAGLEVLCSDRNEYMKVCDANDDIAGGGGRGAEEGTDYLTC